ncbi:splicing arginine serine-rich 19 [Micractinium conductrix]|uniref:Splicing arginine serine-rich 19 n=1 Tax=Micractinium conductrix TaxID=554055 RepID=A0A2P6VHB8_9CHLO|nr:splicing arginine serine-rich 19 [Micractinium conductrix]|eukprot:PSC73483.1 splicing arginine serine-rich 19 [Micractinium conductrix]
MVQILTPASICQQLANLSFLLSAFFGDILLIRICLIMAYLWLMVNACVGFPSWPHINDGPAGEPGYISLDGIIFACRGAAINLFFHSAALLQLLWDERHIKFDDELQSQAWRFFYRRAGFGRLEFKETFDIGLLNVLGVFIAFEKSPHNHTTVTAHTDCLVVFWGLEDLNTLATRASPALSAYWRNFALCQLGLEWNMRQNPLQPLVNARGKPEPAGMLDGSARSSDFTDPQEQHEDPRPTLAAVHPGTLPAPRDAAQHDAALRRDGTL